MNNYEWVIAIVYLGPMLNGSGLGMRPHMMLLWYMWRPSYLGGVPGIVPQTLPLYEY